MKASKGKQRGRMPAFAAAMNKARGRGRRPNPAWMLSSGWREADVPPYQEPAFERGLVERKQIPFGQVRGVLHALATFLVNQWEARAGEPLYDHYEALHGRSDGENIPMDGVGIPFIWQNNTHLVVPRQDEIHIEDDYGMAFDFFSFAETWDAFRAEDPTVLYTPWSLGGILYVRPADAGVVSGIYFWSATEANIDYIPAAQMSLYGLLLALRQEGVLSEQTRLAFGCRDAYWLEEFFEPPFEAAQADYVEGRQAFGFPGGGFDLDAHIAKREEFETVLRHVGASEASFTATTASEMPPDDIDLVSEYLATEGAFEYSEWIDILMMHAGETMQVLAAGPYSSSTRAGVLPFLPGYMPAVTPPPAEPGSSLLPAKPYLPPAPSPPEGYSDYGGVPLAPPPIYPGIQHAPLYYGPPQPPAAIPGTIRRLLAAATGLVRRRLKARTPKALPPPRQENPTNLIRGRAVAVIVPAQNRHQGAAPWDYFGVEPSALSAEEYADVDERARWFDAILARIEHLAATKNRDYSAFILEDARYDTDSEILSGFCEDWFIIEAGDGLASTHHGYPFGMPRGWMRIWVPRREMEHIREAFDS